jgi:hypothetical protein
VDFNGRRRDSSLDPPNDTASAPEEVPRHDELAEVSSGEQQSATENHARCSHSCEWRTREADSTLTRTLPFGYNKGDLLQALPPRQILVQVVEWFNVTFHHWIPFLHKAKCEAEVQKETINPELAPVLHALVAVVLPRLDVVSVGIDHGEIHRQARESRSLALQYAVTTASLQSLQSLLVLVFEQVSLICSLGDVS